MPILEARNLTKVFSRHTSLFRREEIHALDKINLTLEKGSLVVFKGPNGAGKTTLLKILAGLIRPTEGEVWVNGFPQHEPERIHAQIGVASGEERSFYARLTAQENLRFFAATHRLFGKERDRRIDELAAQLELTANLSVRYQELSRGNKARLGLMRALVHDPPLLLLDEPFQSIDADLMHHLKRWISDELVECRKKTILFVSHRDEEFSGWTGRLLRMEQGRICSEDRIENFRPAWREEETRVFQ